MKRNLPALLILLTVVFSVNTISCTPASSLLEKYGEDGYYFLGLQQAEKGETKIAQKSFKMAVEKASPFFAKLSYEELLKYGNRSEQLQTALKFHKAFSDEETLLLICKKLYRDGELSQVIKLTDKIDYAQSADELCYYRISALYQKNNPKFRNAYYYWCTLRKFTSWQYKLYCEVLDINDVITMRANIYTRDYGRAYEAAQYILQDSANYKPQIISDAGKAYLYGSTAYSKNASYFERLTNSLEGDAEFYGHFYTARIYSRMENTKSYAIQKFAQAMDTAPTDSDYDTALWYYLDTSLSSSIKEATAALKKYAPSFRDPEYYDDFFDTLSVRILSQHMWSEFYKTANSISGYASKEASARFAYVSARLIQEGFYSPEGVDKADEINRLLQLAMDCGTAWYYRFVAAEKLAMTDEELESWIFNQPVKDDFEIDENGEKLLSGLMDSNLDQGLYEKFQRYGDKVGLEVTKRLALRLKRDASDKNDFYSRSMRVALKRNKGSNLPYDKEFLKLMYPKAYSTYVGDSCRKYEVPEYLMYGLTRSESFFDPTVSSVAGAKGLTQLMESTAADVAKKLHYAEYDLNDPRTNIEFGCYYISGLLVKFNGSMLPALFGYNAGPGRINTWIKNAETEFSKQSLPMDIFLESIPYSETREYGRKVVAAGCMYAYLYQNEHITKTVGRMLR